MQSYENERIIQQGEDWNLDILLSQSVQEYVPYIISSKRENPHFVMTVASTKFEKNQRYAESWWQEIPSSQPRFKQTTPFYVGHYKTEPNSFSDLRNGAEVDISTDGPMERLYQYTVGDDKEFKYCYTSNNTTITKGYSLRVRFNVLSQLVNNKLESGTSKWNSQEYMYQITLVSGQLMVDTIIDCIDNNPNLNWRTDLPKRSNYTDNEQGFNEYREAMIEFFGEKESRQKDVYEFIKLHLPNFFQKDIDWNSKLGMIWSPVPILKPTILRVDSNLKILI